MTRSKQLAERRRAIALGAGPSVMAAATDFDQSGVFREFALIGMGPSIGWLFMPVFSNLSITAGGTYPLVKGTTYVSVNVAAPVTITLPPAMPVGFVAAISNPGNHINQPITIADVGGNAGAWPITINCVPGDTIEGLASIQITVNFAGRVFSTPTEGGPRVWCPIK
jgi:hypothetical protein